MSNLPSPRQTCVLVSFPLSIFHPIPSSCISCRTAPTPLSSAALLLCTCSVSSAWPFGAGASLRAGHATSLSDYIPIFLSFFCFFFIEVELINRIVLGKKKKIEVKPSSPSKYISPRWLLFCVKTYPWQISEL